MRLASLGAAIYTLSNEASTTLDTTTLDDEQQNEDKDKDKNKKILSPSALVRVYLLRLLMELVLEGIDHLVHAPNENDPLSASSTTTQHTSSMRKRDTMADMVLNRKNPNTNKNSPAFKARIFLDAFSETLTPMWFVCMLSGCTEDASASIAFRLLVLLLQNSATFESSFKQSGGFTSLSMSIPKFSTSPSIILPILSELFNVSLYRLPWLPVLDSAQLFTLFDVGEGNCNVSNSNNGLFGLLSECIGRNAQLSLKSGSPAEQEKAKMAKDGNEAILSLLLHAHEHVPEFKLFTLSEQCLKPLTLALFVCSDEQDMLNQGGGRRAWSESVGGMTDLSSRIDENYINRRGSTGGESGNGGRKASTTRSISDGDTIIPHRKGSTASVNVNENANASNSQRSLFVGPAGVGLLSLLNTIIINSITSHRHSSKLLHSLLLYFPAHATEDQVHNFYSVILEMLGNLVKEVASSEASTALSRPIVFCNLVGATAVLVDNMLSGMFVVDGVLGILKVATEVQGLVNGTKCNRSMGVDAQQVVSMMGLKFAQVCSIGALRLCLSGWGPNLENVTDVIIKNLGLMLMKVHGSGSNDNKEEGGGGDGGLGGVGRKLFGGGKQTHNDTSDGLTLSDTYVAESLTNIGLGSFVESVVKMNVDNSDRMFVTCLLSELHVLFLDDDKKTKEQAATVCVSLLRQRGEMMRGLLILEGSSELQPAIDCMNGAFDLLLGDESVGGSSASAQKANRRGERVSERAL